MQPIDWRVEFHDELTSTSDHCIARAEAGEPAGLVIMAARQTRARGSRGRAWTGGAGNLACSVLLRPADDGALVSAWPFLAGLVLREALAAALTAGAAARLSLKWPNDVLLDNRKLGGVLVERGIGQGGGGNTDWLVIGLGANLAVAPDLPERRAASLAELAPPPEPLAVVALLLAALGRWCAVLARDGFEPIRQAWTGYAHPVGTPLAVRTRDVQTDGLFAGLDNDGALMMRTGRQLRRFETGEILLLAGC